MSEFIHALAPAFALADALGSLPAWRCQTIPRSDLRPCRRSEVLRRCTSCAQRASPGREPASQAPPRPTTTAMPRRWCRPEPAKKPSSRPRGSVLAVDGLYRQRDEPVRTATNLDWDIVGAGDFDGDGDGDGVADVLWRNPRTGANTIWLAADAAQQQGVTSMTDTDWHVSGVADFNGDGRDDIFWNNIGTGGNVIWLSGVSSTNQSVAAMDNRDWKVVYTADFNGDGDADVLWHNNQTGDSVIWKSANANSQQPVATMANPAWKIMNSPSAELTFKSRLPGARTRIFRTQAAREVAPPLR